MHRFLPFIVAGALALGVSAAPALAGSDGCSADCRAENAPAAVVGTVPTGPPAFPDGNMRQASTLGSPRRPPRTAPSPRARAGTEHGPGGVVFAIAGAALVILAAGARLFIAARGSKS